LLEIDSLLKVMPPFSVSTYGKKEKLPDSHRNSKGTPNLRETICLPKQIPGARDPGNTPWYVKHGSISPICSKKKGVEGWIEKTGGGQEGDSDFNLVGKEKSNEVFIRNASGKKPRLCKHLTPIDTKNRGNQKDRGVP